MLQTHILVHILVALATTRSILSWILRTYTGTFSRDFTGDFVSNYSRDFAGEYTGNYSRAFVGEYTGTFVGPSTTLVPESKYGIELISLQHDRIKVGISKHYDGGWQTDAIRNSIVSNLNGLNLAHPDAQDEARVVEIFSGDFLLVKVVMPTRDPYSNNSSATYITQAIIVVSQFIVLKGSSESFIYTNNIGSNSDTVNSQSAPVNMMTGVIILV